MKKQSFITLCLAFCSMTGYAYDLTLQGSGTQEDPYLVTSKADMKQIAEGCNTASYGDADPYDGKYFKMTNDIDMEHDTEFFGIGIAPFSVSNSTRWCFKGTFDGDGHKISNLQINGTTFSEDGTAQKAGANASRKYVGLFGVLTGGTVKNLTLDETCHIDGYSYVGGITGSLGANSAIINCHVAAEVVGYEGYVAGIAAMTNNVTAYIDKCEFSGTVKSCYQYVGGIAGYGKAPISNCINTGDIIGESFNASVQAGKQRYVGGIIGYADAGFSCTNCFNAGSISATYEAAGGIIGYLYIGSSPSVVKNCVNIGYVTSGNERTGQIIGQIPTGTDVNSDVISQCYFDNENYPISGIGEMEDSTLVTGMATSKLAGTSVTLDTDAWTLRSGYYPVLSTLSSETAEAAAACYLTFANGENALDFRTSAQLSQVGGDKTVSFDQGAYYSYANGTVTAGDATLVAKDLIYIKSGRYTKTIEVQKLPTLTVGSGTEADPYIIATKNDLKKLASLTIDARLHLEGQYFKMTNDIDMENDEEFHGIANYITQDNDSYKTYYFSGIFDGGNHTISNMRLANENFDEQGVATSQTSSYSNVGLFGAIGSGAVVKNIILDKSCFIEGYQAVGALVGRAHEKAAIDNCQVYATVKGYYNNTGGIVGMSVEPTSDLDPKANCTTITNCLFGGEVYCNGSSAGGIIGYNYCDINGCANIGTIKGTQISSNAAAGSQGQIGGIAGTNLGFISNCLNTGDVSADYDVAGGIVAYDYIYPTKGHVTNNINVGRVTALDPATATAILGEYILISNTDANTAIQANYNDIQLSPIANVQEGEFDGMKTIKTAALISGNAIEGLSSDVWSFEANKLPSIKAIHSDLLDKAVSTYVLFKENESSDNFLGRAAISDGATATLANGNGFSIANGYVKVDHSAAPADDVLTLTNGDHSRTIALASNTIPLNGAGTEENPWTINSRNDYSSFLAVLDDMGYSFDGDVVSLNNTLDYNGNSFVPAGTSVAFDGTFNGNGNAFKNITYTATNGGAAAIFANIGANGTVNDLYAENCQFTGSDAAGAIAGYSRGTINNCATNDACRINGKYAAGIVGFAQEGAVNKCFNAADITTSNTYAAGIANGAADATVADSYNIGNITAATYAAGIANGTAIQRCYSLGDVSAANAGNITAITSGSVENAYYLDSLTATDNDTTYGATAVSAQDLASDRTLLGDAFTYYDYSFPMLLCSKNMNKAKAYAANFGYAAGESAEMAVTTLQLSQLQGVTWTANDRLSISGNVATVKAKGIATLTATCGEYTRTYSFYADPDAGVNNLLDDSDADGEATYYDLNGIKVTNPRQGDILIKRYKNSKGITISTKMII
jgi:hypothetical protein